VFSTSPAFRTPNHHPNPNPNPNPNPPDTIKDLAPNPHPLRIFSRRIGTSVLKVLVREQFESM